MKKRILKVAAAASMAIVGLAVLTQVWASAQVGEVNDQGLVGSWDIAVTPRNCETGLPAPFPPPFSAVQTYNQGGTMTASVLGAPGVISLDAHGIWSHAKGRNKYVTAFRVLKFNPDGTYAGKDVVRDSISLGLDGNSYTSTGTVEIFDASGNLIVTGCATTTATRFE